MGQFDDRNQHNADDTPFEQLNFEPGDEDSDRIIAAYHGEEYLEELKECMREEYRREVALRPAECRHRPPAISTLGEVYYQQAIEHANKDLGPQPLDWLRLSLQEPSEEDRKEFDDWTDEDWERL